jgi:hypothetical protein
MMVTIATLLGGPAVGTAAGLFALCIFVLTRAV